jgi:hypothetical protein
MITLQGLLNEGRKKDAWLRHCGFIDWSLEEFQQVQERLLLEQIELLSESYLGKKLLGESLPASGEDFRKSVPLTTYKDYHPYFTDKKEEVLPVKPAHWVCTSGKIDEYEQKWAPYPQGMAQTHIKNFLSAVILSVCSKKGELTLKENFKFLYAMAPPPYLTGMVPYGLKDEFPFEYMPPLSVAEKMSFEERNREGFSLGLDRGIDLFFGVSSVLVRIGEKFAQNERSASSQRTSNPKALLRLAKGITKSKLKKRNLLPRDLWSLKGIVCAGTDTSFYKERIEHFWGVRPLEIYGGTEIGIAATQTWDHEGMTFFPDANYWEFIPEDEYLKSRADETYQPSTVLLHELESGKRYELVITNFKGGAFVRYRVGDMIRVLSLRNETLNINLPQIVYEDRIDDVIDLAGFTRINERTIWETLKEAGITHGNWIACKSFSQGHPIVQLYLEMPSPQDSKQQRTMEDKIHQALCLVDADYCNLAEMMAYRPLRLAPISEKAFQMLKQNKPGTLTTAPVMPFERLNPPEKTLRELLAFNTN